MKCEACEHENIEGARFCAKCGAAIPIAILGQTDPLIGQVIAGRFHVTAVLGEGGMGVVYVGEQQLGTTIRKVAVKTLHQHLSNDSNIQARFNREVGTVAGLEHPNTIKVYDFGKTKDGMLYIAMEFVDGKSLADVLLNGGALTPERTVHIMRQICGALDEAHGQGIVHRDLKPDNVILTNRAGETDFVKVLDFGIAARTESADAQKEQKLTQQGMVLGTPPYMSPEQFTGKQLDARSDVYSLGVMAYEMVTGKLPFDAETPWEWATQHMTVAPKPFEVNAPAANIPAGLRQAILKALNKDRTQRQDSARQFFAELSDGGRMTVEAKPVQAPAAAAGGYQPTAAMPQAPAMAPGAYAPTAAQPQVQAPVYASAPIQPTGPAVVAPVMAAVPAAPARGGGGPNKGLLFGLGGVGLVLVVAIVIVAIRSNKPDETGPITAPLGGPSSPAVVVTGEAPMAAAAASGAVAATAEPAEPAHKVTGHAAATKPRPSASSGAAAPATSANPVATPGAATAATPAAPAATPAAPAANDPCSQCVAAANGGNITGAQSSFAKCTDPGQRAACVNAVKRNAAKAAKAAATGGQCPHAKAIVAAATAMGAASPAINAAVAGCP